MRQVALVAVLARAVMACGATDSGASSTGLAVAGSGGGFTAVGAGGSQVGGAGGTGGTGANEKVDPNVPSASVIVVPSGVHGGGAINVVAADPFAPGRVLIGGDVSGVHASSNWGGQFAPSNRGLFDDDHHHIATLVFSETVPGKVYAGSGKSGQGGGFFRSLDHGATWTRISVVPQFSGTDNASLPATAPRSIGRLVELDETRNLIYAATFDQGVLRSADDGVTWTSVSPTLQGKYLRGIVRDPANPRVLYVGTYGAGAYKLTVNATTLAVTTTALTAAPATVEELAFVGTTLVVAAGANGLLTSSNGGASFVQRLPANSGSSWQSLGVGPKPGGGARLYVGCDVCAVQGNGYTQTFLVSDDAGKTFANGIASGGVHHTLYASNVPWWRGPTLALVQGVASPVSNGLGDAGGFAAGFAFHPTDPGKVMLASAAAPWASADYGANVFPAARGTGLVVGTAAFVGPSGDLWFGMYDWGALRSSDLGATVSWNRPDKAMRTARSFSVDALTGRLFVATSYQPSSNGGQGGAILSLAQGGAAWSVEGDDANFGSGNYRPVAVHAGRDANGQLVLLAALSNQGGAQNQGVWRRVGNGAWSRVLGGPMASPAGDVMNHWESHASFVWGGGASPAYVYDRKVGLFRSTDAGATWQSIWGVTSTAERTGYLVADPKLADVLWIATDSGLYRLAGASGKPVVSAMALPGSAVPSAIAARSDGTLYVAVAATASAPVPALFALPMPTTTSGSLGPARKLSNAAYEAMGARPNGLAVTDDGHFAVSFFGTGFATGYEP